MFYTTNKQIETYRDHLVEMVRIHEENIFNLKIKREQMEGFSGVTEISYQIRQEIGLRTSYEVALESFNSVFTPGKKELDFEMVFLVMAVACFICIFVVLFI